MQKAFKLIIAALLLGGAGFAKEKSVRVEDIFKELSAYEPAPPAAVEPAAPKAAEEKPAPIVKPAQIVVEKKPAKAVQPLAVELVQNEPAPAATIAPGREPVRDSESTQAQEGLESIVKVAPESIAARLYPRTLLERDQRTAEVAGLKAVDAAWSTERVFRSYALGKDACEKMKLKNVTRATNVSDVFPEVDFPKGASAIYQPSVQALFVNNTRENLAVLESVLGGMGLAGFSTATDQVEIETKFVEVSEGTLEELGFQWNFNNAVSANIGGSDLTVDDQPNGLFANALRGSPNGSSPDLPFKTSNNIGGPDRVSANSANGDWTAFGIADTFASKPDSIKLRNNGSDPFDLLISALDQSSGTDVLSAPRVTTRSGEEATIRVGELHSYPEVFEGDSSEATILNVSYTDFSEKLLGVELTVTPIIDGGQITLSLNPKITEIAGWQQYQLAPANSIYNHRQIYKWKTYTHPPITAQLPILKKREIKSEVTIADGSTIGMGGLINEKNEAFKDSVPVLGSIPLIGRLFRNEGERVVKRNLLIFVTAKKVEPSGRINTTRSFE